MTSRAEPTLERRRAFSALSLRPAVFPRIEDESNALLLQRSTVLMLDQPLTVVLHNSRMLEKNQTNLRAGSDSPRDAFETFSSREIALWIRRLGTAPRCQIAGTGLAFP